MTSYHITRLNGTQEGPFSEEELKELYRDRKLPPDSLIWAPGWDTWKICKDTFSWYVLPPSLPKRTTPPPVSVALNNEQERKISPFLQDAWLHTAIGVGLIVICVICLNLWPKARFLGHLILVGFVSVCKGIGHFRKHSIMKEGEIPQPEHAESVHLQVSHKSSIIAGLLAIFLGSVGVHKFYNGSWGWGIIYIVIAAAAWGSPSPLFGISYMLEIVLALIQGIWWLANPIYYHRRYNEESPAPMKW